MPIGFGDNVYPLISMWPADITLDFGPFIDEFYDFLKGSAERFEHRNVRFTKIAGSDTINIKIKTDLYEITSQQSITTFITTIDKYRIK